MAGETALEPIVKDSVNLFVCMVVLIVGYWVEMLVSTRSSLRLVLLIIEAAESPAA